jgi:copper(I)-binding protein
MKHACKRLLIAFGMLASTAFAADTVTVSNAWVRATAPGQEVGAAYLDMKSASDARLVKVETSAAGSVEIHSMAMKNGVMKMRMLEEMALPAGKTVSLAPGGFHLMLFDLKQPLKAGEKVLFTFIIKDRKGKATTQQVTAPIRAGKD